jgi:hypothetical protein
VTVVACLAAAPAHAADLATAVQAPPTGPVTVTGHLPAAEAVSVTPAANAAESVAQAAGSVEQATSDMADAAGAAGSPPPAAPATTVAAPHFRDATSAPGEARRAIRADASASTSSKSKQPRTAPPRQHPRPVGPPAGPATEMEAGGASRSTVAGSAPSATAPAPALDLVSGAGAGSPAAGDSTGVSFGGLAVLLIALFLAAPHLRSRLSGLRAICWPAAFVPLLERPG